MKITICFSAIVLLLLSSLGIASSPGEFKPGSEPDGFRDIKWGTDISNFSEMQLLKDWGAGRKSYKRLEDNLEFGTVALIRVTYSFWQGKFYKVQVETVGSSNYLALEKFINKKFGEFKRTEIAKNCFNACITGIITRMTLFYWKPNGVLDIESMKIISEMEKPH